ncbi:NAD(P)/FAD-dependent oxidoreductase [Salipaludibacillus aurantiacus]|uniref:D-amino-acid dehydrogenase n=1 Tax=Salipaludibacillus aurantiacus TaxID=1601833 RepID=A0A1H9VTS7_9BACI|nr:FAD-dependent oxidoreductase [Salipaludibacillus aurantiacus]SES25075.1 D-amino-acid dehydrogenase [Salipaludibacillus aurantiacus]
MKSYIVIGGGILGASTAFHLAKQGCRVTLIDRRDQGQATDAGAGIICPWLSQRRNKAWYRLVKGGAKFYPGLIKELEDLGEVNTGYARVGALTVHHDETKLDKIEERAYKRREDAPEIGDIKRMTSAETKACFPPLADGYGSVYVSGGARVNGRSLRDSLINASEKLGVRIIKGDASLIMENNRAAGAEVNGEKIEADAVVAASGAWADELLTPIGLNFSVKPQKGQIVHLTMKNINNERWPVIIPPGDYYILSFGNGRIVAGATREDDTGFDNTLTLGGLQKVFNEALAVAPGLAKSAYVEARVGFRPFTPGFLPVAGPVPETKGLFAANGLGASGLTSGPYLGSQLADLVVGKPVELDLNDYNINEAIKRDRFGV